MAAKPTSPTEQLVNLLDVHVVDVVAEIEALLRGIREAQRNVLRVRGVPLAGENPPIVEILQRLDGMLKQCDTLRDAVLQARDTAWRLSERA